MSKIAFLAQESVEEDFGVEIAHELSGGLASTYPLQSVAGQRAAPPRFSGQSLEYDREGM